MFGRRRSSSSSTVRLNSSLQESELDASFGSPRPSLSLNARRNGSEIEEGDESGQQHPLWASDGSRYDRRELSLDDSFDAPPEVDSERPPLVPGACQLLSLSIRARVMLTLSISRQL